MDLSIIIVSYNTKELLRKCLKSVFTSQTGYKFEVLVSDNGSQDGSAGMVRQEFPQVNPVRSRTSGTSVDAFLNRASNGVKLIENHANLGFSKGNNVALKQAAGRYCLLLNSDTEVRLDTFDLSVKYMDQHPEAGIMGVKVLLPDGSLDKASRRKFPNPWNSFLRLFGLKKFSDYNISTPVGRETEVDSVMGAYLMIRKAAMDKIGMLDEEYFMYGEDLDWCWRAKEAGYKVMYYPEAEITHYKYGSAQMMPIRTIRMAHEAMKIFYRKHYAKKYNPFFNGLVYLGINLRMYLVLFANIFRNKKTVH